MLASLQNKSLLGVRELRCFHRAILCQLGFRLQVNLTLCKTVFWAHSSETLIEQWRQLCNIARLHSLLGYLRRASETQAPFRSKQKCYTEKGCAIGGRLIEGGNFSVTYNYEKILFLGWYMKTIKHRITEIARDCLHCIETVAADAEEAKQNRKRNGTTPLAIINDFNRPELANAVQSARDAEMDALAALIKEPVIARVHFIDENGKEDTIFIARTTPRSIPGFKIASYRAPLVRIASLAAGEEDTFRYGESERELLINSSARLKPRCEQGQWDARETEIDIRDFGPFTIKSLRNLLKPNTHVEKGDIEGLWDDHSDGNIVEGGRRAILTQMGLRDQPILDRHQDEIFRMPINSRCFLSGPPGAGKTTTLIRRLGQKTDWDALEASGEQIRLIRKVEEETGRSHERSWILFSPTELLRQSVKEACNREGLAASDEQIRTWDEFRRELARDKFGLLQTSAGNGRFVERRTQDYLKPEVLDEAQWYDDFRGFLDGYIAGDLLKDADFLAKCDASDLSKIGQLLQTTFKKPARSFYAHTMRSVVEFIPEIQRARSSRDEAINRILTQTRNALTYADRRFPELLRQEISRQFAVGPQDADEGDELEASLEDEEERPITMQARGLVSRQDALKGFERALKYLALVRQKRGRISEKSRNGLLLKWLGTDRIPTDTEILRLGKLLIERTRLRRLERLERRFLSDIPNSYRRFRIEMARAGRWYKTKPAKASDIHWQELDILILATLQIGNELLNNRRNGTGLPKEGFLAHILHAQRAQILVDEAADFSLVQLACMKELAHPFIGSLFFCGDINQRLTPWGVKTYGSLNWLGDKIKRRSITVSYRQSQRLVDVAKQIATIGGALADDITLPNRVDAEGLPPVWHAELNDNSAVAEWLAKRIKEVDRIVQKATTIAVLVTEEEQVEQLAEELNDRLEEINLSAAACKDGKVVGNDRDVRVFDIRHIKGLEFEAVFFVDLDQLVFRYPDLFAKYLYVGATRAATYLGVTFKGQVPKQIEPLMHHFGEDWSVLGVDTSLLAARSEARQLSTTAADMVALKAAIEGFDGCPLKELCHRAVVFDGVIGAPVMVIGDGPGEQEDRTGGPFVGKAGELLDKMLGAIGLDRKTNTFITNVNYWRTPDNRSPKPEELAVCRPFVERMVDLNQPKLILAMGGVAAQSLLETRSGIMQLRGHEAVFTTLAGTSVPLIPMFHPAYLLQHPPDKSRSWRDLLLARARLQALGVIL